MFKFVLAVISDFFLYKKTHYCEDCSVLSNSLNESYIASLINEARASMELEYYADITVLRLNGVISRTALVWLKLSTINFQPRYVCTVLSRAAAAFYQSLIFYAL